MNKKLVNLRYLALNLLLSTTFASFLYANELPIKFNNEQDLIAAMTPNNNETNQIPDLTILAQDILQLLEEHFEVGQPDEKCTKLEESFLKLYQTVSTEACDYLARINHQWATDVQTALNLYKFNPNINTLKYFTLHQAAHHFALLRVLTNHDKVILKLYSPSCNCDIDRSVESITKRSPEVDVFFLQASHAEFCIPGIEIKKLPTLLYFKNGKLLGISDYQNEETLKEYMKIAFGQ